jgi:hypothetical protein
MTAPAANDKTTLWGVIGIVGAICCPIVGLIFGILSMQEAKKSGKPNTLGIVALVLAAVNIVWSIIAWSSGIYSFNTTTTTS